MNQFSAMYAMWTPSDRMPAGNADRSQTLMPHLCPQVVMGGILRVSNGVAVAERQEHVEATWRDHQWRTALQEPSLTIAARPNRIIIGVPPVWRAHAYLGWRGGQLLISSSLRDLAATMEVTDIAAEGVAAYVAGNRATSGLSPSLYSGIWEVQPGHTATVDADNQMRCQRTWTPERDASFNTLHLEAATERVRGRLDEVAQQILATHDRVACLFSGGLDSTLIAATLLRRAPQRVVLFNVGSGLGTSSEANLRARFLREYDTRTISVDLPPQGSLLRSLRATNASAALPAGSLFAHIFEEIMFAARERGCDAIVTGDGGDEVFAEREEVLVDLLARRSLSTFSAAGHFALRNGERATRTVRRGLQRLHALNNGLVLPDSSDPTDSLLGEELASLVMAARTASATKLHELWAQGWTYSGLGSWRRAASVPDWEPVSAETPEFPVISPLADAELVTDALALRRDELLACGVGAQPKWLLRQAALDWLSPEVALHPKIGNADMQIMDDLRSREHRDLLDLFSSSTAQRLGIRVTSALENPDASLWFGDAWIRTASLVAWAEQDTTEPAVRSPIVLSHEPSLGSPAHQKDSTAEDLPGFIAPPLHQLVSPRWWEVAALAALNLAAQCLPSKQDRRSKWAPRDWTYSASATPTAHRLIALARRACAVPVISASSEVMNRALAWYLRLTGSRPILVRGSAKNQFMTQWWIEVDGSVVDISGAETPLVPDRD